MESMAPPPSDTINLVEIGTAFVRVVRTRVFVVLVTFLLGLVAVAMMFFFLPRTYQGESRVLIVADHEGRDPSVSSVDLPSVATSTAVLSRVLADVNSPLTLASLKHALKAKVADRSGIMEITFDDTSPDRALTVPNAVADELSKYYNSIAASRADVTLHNLDGAIADTQARLRAVNTDLAQISGRYPFLAADKPLDAISAQLGSLQEQRAVAYAALTADQAMAAAVSPQSPEMVSIARHERLASDPVYGQLVGITSKDTTSLVIDKATFSSQYPGLQPLQQKIATERAAIASEEQAAAAFFSNSQAQSTLESAKAAAVASGDRMRVAQFDALIGTANQALHEYQVADARSATLKLQQTAAQADFLTLSARRTAAIADRAASLSLGSVVVVDRAVKADTTVVGTGRVQLALIMTIVVSMVALAAAPIADLLDPRLRRSKQIERLYGAPLLTKLGESA